MPATPVVDGDAPPSQVALDIRATREGDGLADLVGTHASSRAIAALDGGGVWCCIAQCDQRLLCPLARAMREANIDLDDSCAFSSLDDLNMRQ